MKVEPNLGVHDDAPAHTPFERTWQLTEKIYANNGIDIHSLPVDRTLGKLTREEWLYSEEEARRAFDTLAVKAGRKK